MNVEELFRNIRDIKNEITVLDKKEQYLELSMLPGAIRYDKDKVQTTPEDPMLKFAEQISEIEELRKVRYEKLLKQNIVAETILNKMRTPKYRTLLFLRYIEGGVQYRYSWSEVALNLGYDEQYVRWDLHHAALDEAQEISDSLEEN